jgi:hypothetical protein
MATTGPGHDITAVDPAAERLADLGHPNGDEPRWCTLGGYYTNSLIRTSEGWRIRRCQLNITWTTGELAPYLGGR